MALTIYYLHSTSLDDLAKQVNDLGKSLGEKESANDCSHFMLIGEVQFINSEYVQTIEYAIYKAKLRRKPVPRKPKTKTASD